jgi:hypothetical protein
MASVAAAQMDDVSRGIQLSANRGTIERQISTACPVLSYILS